MKWFVPAIIGRAAALVTPRLNIRRWRLPMPNQYTKNPRTPAERFWAKVDKNGPIPSHRPDLGVCWLWLARKDYDGYGRFTLDRRNSVAYHFLAGPAPSGLEWDHLCRNRACVRPDHLEAVTSRMNTLRGETAAARNAAKTHCPQGHLYDLFNTYFNKVGGRVCRICGRAYGRAWYKKRHGVVLREWE